MSPKEEFIAIFTENIKREGARELLAWLETTDFFSAPASTKFHCACEGGLVQHSLSVYHTLMDRYFESLLASAAENSVVTTTQAYTDLDPAAFYDAWRQGRQGSGT